MGTKDSELPGRKRYNCVMPTEQATFKLHFNRQAVNAVCSACYNAGANYANDSTSDGVFSITAGNPWWVVLNTANNDVFVVSCDKTRKVADGELTDQHVVLAAIADGNFSGCAYESVTGVTFAVSAVVDGATYDMEGCKVNNHQLMREAFEAGHWQAVYEARQAQLGGAN